MITNVTDNSKHLDIARLTIIVSYVWNIRIGEGEETSILSLRKEEHVRLCCKINKLLNIFHDVNS